ncbi:MAG: peptidoglycan DD-metalloendopeptidase family protein [cyanobacterium endosymbiont of Rhopalodia musculus]|uniref:LysM peptidoglycan-binding domain-containing M23 family metallopeptidase n=1 Tax=cyanobacterium endosymbiont of Epithemia clementina EcSB TaxID=3034674 RepID=UPI00247FC29F|nr:M23 family metallopeptidase [cyanobacterium endosymbiont of Epithemia clementina EcSB]WGT68391.1 M23 family metallopeptidase [cyanobacterium endosymbiont of Epithemia clementina EcSB]
MSSQLLLTLLVSLIPPMVNLAKISPSRLCPTPVLSRLQRHQVVSGESLSSIAQNYNLIPETLVRLNPNLKRKSVRIGQKILIPPFNGIRVKVPNGATWNDLATAYGIRADVLFEINGCVKTPTVVYIPGVNWQIEAKTRRNDYIGLGKYPLPSVARVGLTYGWHRDPTTRQSFFHGGIDLLAQIGTSVLAADTGRVIFAAQEGTYGFLVVVDHGDGRQTRYAHLNRFQVKIGQTVRGGDIVGYVGKTGRPDLLESHLHFEVRYKFPVGWVAQDPLTHLPKL